MTRLSRIVTFCLAAAVGMSGLELGGGLPIPFGVKEAEARVGRPLTPLSVAGTTRRVARRTAYRINTLPAGCVYGLYYGAYYHNCGGVYYVKDGTVYVKVVFD